MISHQVMTTEKVPFTYRVAGLGSRLLAWLVDSLLIVLTSMLFFAAGMTLEASKKEGLGIAVMLVLLFSFHTLYYWLFEWLWHGQTPGKRLLGIRVIQMQGTAVSFLQAGVRNLLRFVDGMPGPLQFPAMGIFMMAFGLPGSYALGFVVAACNREQRRLGDLAAGTLVVHVEGQARPTWARHDGRAEAGHLSPGLIRQRLGLLDRAQKQLLMDLCLRRDQLSVANRARLFRVAADYLKNRLDLDAGEFQSDEKFVLQVAAEIAPASTRAAEPPAGLAVGRKA
jgi:uncharacterized RDD family membrane protein YckC